MTGTSKYQQGKKGSAEGDRQQLNIIIYSSSDNTNHHFCVSPHMTVAAFLELALERLNQGEGAERVQLLRRYYEPVLELHSGGESRELPCDKGLLEAGVSDQAVCRIAARPRKERIMFCSSPSYS